MFSLVVLSALLVAAAAEPGALIARPYAYSPFLSTSYVAPAVATTYAAPIAPALSPFSYSTGYGYAHLIKKRSAPFFAPAYYSPSTYLARPNYVAPLSTTYSYSAPLVSSAITYNAPIAHLIKKRSVAIAPLATSYASSYVAPTTYATYGAAPYYSSAYATSYYRAPLAYSSPFFIKK